MLKYWWITINTLLCFYKVTIYYTYFFLYRENCVGPSVYTEYVEEV